MSNMFGPSPPPQVPHAGAMKRRYESLSFEAPSASRTRE
jgi:hypothetical protein